jgi:hypothetical protein
MARKTKPTPKAAAPQFDEAPLADDEEEGACPIPDEHGEVVLLRGKPTTKGVRRGKGKAKPTR